MTGSVVTFYSYKGGVGRSFLLANVAVLLARWNYRTLCVDWDIEAPGLDEYFRPWLGTRQAPGVVDLATQFAATGSADWRAHINELKLPGAERALHLMVAGARGPDLPARIQTIDWRELYNNRKFGDFIEKMRSDWKAAYDIVLIDSRTGITDIGGICTVHLPDILVLVFTANQQSLSGIKSVAAMADAQRSKLPLNRAGLLTLPVLARFDARGQDDLAKQWMRRIADELDELYDSWLDSDVAPRQFLDMSRIPYLSAWTFGERLSVLEERDNDPESISYYFATIAALLARGLEDAGSVCRSRDAYVEVARDLKRDATPGVAHGLESLGSVLKYQFYLSYSPKQIDLATQLAAALRATNHSIFFDADVTRPGPGLRDALENAATHCQHFVILREAALPSRWQQYELTSFAEASQNDSARLIFELQLSPSAGDSLEAVTGFHVDPKRVRRINATSLDAARMVAEMFPGDAAPGPDAPVDAHLRQMADTYVTIRIEDYAAENDLPAAEMGAYVRHHRISRDELARTSHPGLTMALAEAAIAAPQPGDLARVTAAGRGVRQLQVAFRVITAINSLIERERVTPADRRAIESLLASYLNMIESYYGRLDNSVGEPLSALVTTTQRRLTNLT